MPSPQFTPEALDYELARRQRFPPTSLDHYPNDVREEWISIETLRDELARTPADHPEYDWRCWELALAERQAEYFPNRRFYRVVDR